MTRTTPQSTIQQRQTRRARARAKGASSVNNSKSIVAMVAIAFVIAIGAMTGRTASAATNTVALATAATYSVLAGQSVTNTGPTTTDNKVGVSPGTSVTGFPPGLAGGMIHAADGDAGQAQSDLGIAYNDAAGRTPFLTVSGDLGGQSLVSGVYRGGGLGLTGVLTLDGQNDPASVWIFQAASGLTTASGSYVSFVNGASPCNVFWQIGSSAALGTGSTFVGTIMALTSITLGDSVTVYGRALARNGDVTLINDRFLSSACASAPLLIPPTRPPFGTRLTLLDQFTGGPFGGTVAFHKHRVDGRLYLPSVTHGLTTMLRARVFCAAAPTATPRPAAVAGTLNLPSTSTGDPANPLAILGVALTGLGILLLRRPIRHL